MTRMYNVVGTPEDAQRRENAWRTRLMIIEEKLNTFQKSHIIPPASPESQVSCKVGYFHNLAMSQFFNY